jgi:hypothetical protein
MKRKVSIKELFTVIGLGLWQGLCCIGGVFNYKRKTPFWRVIWATITLCVLTLTVIICYEFYQDEMLSYSNKGWLSDSVYSREGFFKGYVIGKEGRIGGKIRGVEWLVPSENWCDTMVVYSKGGKRGYLDRYTGDVVIKPIYDKAWVFSEGTAAVVQNDSLYFIDVAGNKLMSFLYYKHEKRNYVFHGGLCLMTDKDNNCGLIDKQGKWEIPAEFDDIAPFAVGDNGDYFYRLEKDAKFGMVNSKGEVVIPCIYYAMEITQKDGIFVYLEDHSQRHADYEGNMTDEFVSYNIQYLDYEIDEFFPIKEEEDEEENGWYDEPIRKTKRAKLLSYTVQYDFYMGLIDGNGKILTPPIYKKIIAINDDLYSCGYDDRMDNAVLVNGKGEVVKVK